MADQINFARTVAEYADEIDNGSFDLGDATFELVAAWEDLMDDYNDESRTY